MSRFLKWDSTNAFRNCLKQVTHDTRYIGTDDLTGEPIYNNAVLPVLDFVGTVKLHGTNGAIGLSYDDKTIWAQSRSQILGSGNTNMGFWNFVDLNESHLKDILSSACEKVEQQCFGLNPEPIKDVLFYGEWFGKGIQDKAAVTHLQDKKFAIFGITVMFSSGLSYRVPEEIVETVFEDLNMEYVNAVGLFNIYQFGKYNLTIDFNNSELAIETLTRITEEVEANCPAGKFFEITSSTVGEGVVWTALSDPQIKFKVKGDKHKVANTKALVDVSPEVMGSIEEFVDYAVTENRLEQGLSELKQNAPVGLSEKHIGAFIKWVQSDIVKEELDTLQESGLTTRDVWKHIANKAKTWFCINGLGYTP